MKRSLPAVFVLLSLFACGPAKERELKSWDIEEIARIQLSTKGRPAPQVFCEGHHLDARVGASTVCYVYIEGRQHDVTMTVTEVKGRETSFDIEVADTPRPLAKSERPEKAEKAEKAD